jgi:inosine-uridine nucleoside N-ribohydrolase
VTVTPQIILDTDIGTDVDDALALAMLLGSQETELLGITCVYGDTATRARLAARLARLAGRVDLPVFAGNAETRAGREVFWAGHEGDRLEADDAGGYTGGPDGRAAVDFLTGKAADAPGAVSVLAVGPLTNLAAAVEADPAFARNVASLVLMGGSFAEPGSDPPAAEHNIACDPEAAAVVFSAGAPITVVGLDVTTTTWLSAEHVASFEAVGALGPELRAQLETWWAYTGKRGNVPHDPLAGLAVLRPELFTFADWHVEVDLGGDRPGRTVTGAASGTGPAVRVARTVRAEDAVDDIVARITAACR